jgi:hypothetical protein
VSEWVSLFSLNYILVPFVLGPYLLTIHIDWD